MTPFEKDVRAKALLEASVLARNWIENVYKKEIASGDIEKDSSWYRGMDIACSSIANRLVIKAAEVYVENDRI